MRICVAQTRPIKGDIQSNIVNHIRLIDLAVSIRANIIIFPELSLTGYEPELAKELATTPDDSRFNNFQQISDTQQITIGVGVPTLSYKGICITLALFSPHQARQTYSKKYLHQDEKPFFVSGQNSLGLLGNKNNAALAICYEISIPAHAENAFERGAEIYIASVVKSVNGMEKAIARLAEIASKYSMSVLMANSVGYCDNFECGGKTSAWNKNGLLIGQLNEIDEGILLLDTETKELILRTVKS